MTLLSYGIGCGFAVLVLTKIISSVIARRRWQAKEARLGCQPAPAARNLGFLGLAGIWEYLRAVREERGPPYVVKAMDGLDPSGTIHTAIFKGEHHLVAHEGSLLLTSISVGRPDAVHPRPRECEGHLRYPGFKF